MLSKNTEIGTIKIIECTNVENTTLYKIVNMAWFSNNILYDYEPTVFNRCNNRICGNT